MPRLLRLTLAILLGVLMIGPQTHSAHADDFLDAPWDADVFDEADDELAFNLEADTGGGNASAKPQANPDVDSLLKRIESLEKAEKKRNDSEKKKKEDEAKKAEDWQDMSTDKWNVKMGGHIQMDFINWADSTPTIPNAVNYFEFRRVRLAVDGTGYGVYDFRFQPTMEPETVGTNPPGITTSPDIKDAYFSINEVPYLGRIRIGNFFVPFSLEQVTNDTNTVFLERSIPSQGVFCPDREVGVAAYNCTEDQRATWTYGVFLDSISEALKERFDNNQGCRVSGRATWLPYYDEPSNGRYLVHTGVGVLYTHDQDERVRFAARPQIREGSRIIDSGNLAATSYTTGNLEGAVVYGPFCLQTEAFLSYVDMINTGGKNVGGAYVQGTYTLTGENRNFERFGQHGAQFARPSPFNNVFFTRSGAGLGAWELKARWSNLDLTSVTRGTYNDMTLGCNWYWSDRVRMMFEWIHPVTSSEAVFGETRSDILGMRFDFNW